MREDLDQAYHKQAIASMHLRGLYNNHARIRQKLDLCYHLKIKKQLLER
jgi:hypothetical protein